MLITAAASGVTLLASQLAFRRVAPPLARTGPAETDFAGWRATTVQLALYSTTMLVIGQVDIVVTGSFLGPEAAGSYATASRISKFVPFGMTAVNLALMPLVSRLFHAGQRDELQRVVSVAATGILAVTLPLGIGAIAFARPLLGLFGPEFVSAQGALVVLTVGRMANALCGPTAVLLTMSGNQRDAAAVALGAAALDAVLLLLLLPRFGMMGAAVATATTTMAWNFVQLPLVRRRTGIRPSVLPILRRVVPGVRR
jgi:O-antigen/teichoic acid export membrane protein